MPQPSFYGIGSQRLGGKSIPRQQKGEAEAAARAEFSLRRTRNLSFCSAHGQGGSKNVRFSVCRDILRETGALRLRN
jgi:hypothetical protein